MKLCKGAVLALAVSYGLIYCHTNKSKFMLEQKGDSLTLIHITNPTNYILLPIEEAAEESRVRLDIGDAADTDMDIRLAQTKVDYCTCAKEPWRCSLLERNEIIRYIRSVPYR